MLVDRFRLDGKVAVVTGAGRGIGAGCALAFAEQGANVVCAARTKEQVEATCAQARTHGVKALPVVCDVMQRADLEGVVAATMAEFGRADILVNNAGGTPPMEALHTSEALFEEAFRFNVTSAFLMTRLLVPKMLDIAADAGRLVMAGFVADGTAKAALSFMTRELGREFAPKVRVNAVAVGAVETSALAPFLDDELRGKMEALTPMRRIGTVDDIALAALYLASPASSWVTGKVFEVDGGTEATNWPFEPPSI